MTDTPESVSCPRCESKAPSGTTNCPSCGVFLPRNEASLRHGLRRYQARGALPQDVEDYIRDFRAELISDQGGEEDLSAIRRGLIDKLVDLEVGVRLLMAEVVVRGIDSRPGKTAWRQALRTIDSWHRVAGTLGIERRERQVRLAEYLQGREREADGDHADA